MAAVEVGSYARYVRTGTVGKVVDVRERDGVRWFKLDSTGLYYREDYLEPVDEEEVRGEGRRGEDVEEVIRRIEELKEAFSGAGVDHVCEGG